jgi:hypothetical protein
VSQASAASENQAAPGCVRGPWQCDHACGGADIPAALGRGSLARFCEAREHACRSAVLAGAQARVAHTLGTPATLTAEDRGTPPPQTAAPVGQSAADRRRRRRRPRARASAMSGASRWPPHLAAPRFLLADGCGHVPRACRPAVVRAVSECVMLFGARERVAQNIIAQRRCSASVAPGAPVRTRAGAMPQQVFPALATGRAQRMARTAPASAVDG